METRLVVYATLAAGFFCLAPGVPRPLAPAPAQSGALQIVETFDTQANLDVPRTGAAWGGGDLSTGIGGGSGRLGDLVVPSGATVVLSTDSEDFSAIGDPAVFDPAGVIDPLPVTGGIFEFATVEVAPGGVLRFAGSNPARLFARGSLTIEGSVDLTGETPGEHDSLAHLDGGPPGAGGPGGFAGGQGADAPDGSAFVAVGGSPNPGAVIDGRDGEGIPVPTTTLPTGSEGGGCGGLHWPMVLPSDVFTFGDVVFDIILFCQTKMTGSAGGGGGYALPGGKSENAPLGGGGIVPPVAPDACGGTALDLSGGGKTLSPERGLLRGGSGGGGGGASVEGTGTNGQLFINCEVVFGGSPAEIVQFVQHSAAGGGGGGGAGQFQAGDLLDLQGVIDASGGAGGSTPGLSVPGAPGGGGSGGAILAQARRLALSTAPERLVVRGGDGGDGASGTDGGAGGAGVVRVERSREAPDAAQLQAIIAPDPAELAALGASPDDISSFDTWEPKAVGPGARNGAMSCWIRPAGVHSYLEFLDDRPEQPGWDMIVFVEGAGVRRKQSWRGDNDLFPISLEEAVGTDLGSAPIVVRFQGARAAVPPADLCDVALHGAGAEIVPGSLTPWVVHPAELNAFPADPAKEPDMFRFQVIFDRSQGDLSEALSAVDDLGVLARPIP